LRGTPPLHPTRFVQCASMYCTSMLGELGLGDPIEGRCVPGLGFGKLPSAPTCRPCTCMGCTASLMYACLCSNLI
jgi:hypothetical protein